MSARTLCILLGIGVLVSALAQVWVQHDQRRSFIELQQLEAERDALEIEWSRLQLEQSAWATHGRIERLAREDLGMTIPDPENVVIVRP